MFHRKKQTNQTNFQSSNLEGFEILLKVVIVMTFKPSRAFD